MNHPITVKVLALFAVFAIRVHNTPAAERDSPLNITNKEAWKAHILPTEKESAWAKIPWLPDLQSGIDAAMESGKPVLLWTMNGHPLGCT